MDIREDVTKRQKRMLGYFFLAYSALLLFFTSWLSPFYSFNDWPDVNIYFNVAKAMMNGQTLYKDVFDHKGPLIFVIYSLGYLVSGKTFLGVFILQVVSLFIGITFAYKIASLYLDRFFSVLVALAYSVLLLLYNGKGGSPEEFIITFQIISVFWFLKFCKSKKKHDPFWMLIHGAMLGLAFFTKLNLVVFWAFPILSIFVYYLVKGEYHLIIRNIITLLLGFFLVALPFALYFFFTNSLYDFWHSYIEFNALYADLRFDYDFVMGIVALFFRFCKTNYIFMSFVSIGLIAFTFSRIFTSNWYLKVGVLLSFALTFTVIFMTIAVFEYYYISLLPYAFLGCIPIAILVNRVIQLPQSNLICGSACLLFLGLGVWFKYVPEPDFSTTPIKQLSDSVLKEKKADGNILCVGIREVGVFTETGLKPSVKYFFTPNVLYEKYPAITDAQCVYIENKETEFVVIRSTYMYNDKYRPFLDRNYKIINTFVGDGGAYYILLYQRK